jgi:hypothetical protein
VITRKGFSPVVNNTFAGLGFSREAPTLIEFPVEMFLPDSDLSPLQDHIDKIIYGLTKWQPVMKERKREVPERITVEGKDYEEAMARMNDLFLSNLWSDGLPLFPPTEDRVKWILSGTALSPDRVIGKILPRGRIATVETLAVNLAMTGGKPEYLPVLIAAIEAIIDPVVVHHVFNTTTCSVYPAMIVNGPVAKQIHLNSGYGCLGPSPIYPAGGVIGRAIRFILLNVGGGIPGRGSMAIYGGPARYTNIVFAEDEDGIPHDWEPLNVSYFGYPRGTNTVTVYPVAGTSNIVESSVSTAETALSTLYNFAKMMGVPNWNYWSRRERFEAPPGILLMARGTAQGLSRYGWTREKVQAFLWENSKVPWSAVKNTSPPHLLEDRCKAAGALCMNEPWPITSKPENIMIVVAGGEQSGHGYWMQIGTSFKPSCKEIKVPANMDGLIKETYKPHL